MRTFSMTDIGQKREVNQDYVYTTSEPLGPFPNLFVVADGMGGHQAGDFASKYTVEVLLEELQTKQEGLPEHLLRDVIQTANKKLLNEAEKDEKLTGMGTTLIVATVIDQTLYFANVGDSRLYIIGDGIQQVSKDHSLVQEMVRLGGINEEEAKHHPDKNIITRAIGAKEDVDIDFFEYQLESQDTILICTDGLSNMVEDEEICQIVKSSRDIVEGVEALIKKANENGGSDNIGVVLIKPFAGEVSI